MHRVSTLIETKLFFVVIVIVAAILSIVPQKELYPRRLARHRNDVSHYHNIDDKGKGPVIDILNQVGVITEKETISRLPTWSTIEKLYGNDPIIRGLSTCATFREMNNDVNEIIILSSGLFNTGSTLLRRTIKRNCKFAGEVQNEIWWKHSPAHWAHKDDYLLYNKKRYGSPFKIKPYKKSEDEEQFRNILVVANIKDPYFWMLSMCKKPYSVKWNATERYCPNLAPGENIPESNLKPNVDVFANYPHVPPDDKSFHLQYTSLVEYWNQYNDGYLKAPFPHLMIRYEDVLFHAEEVTRQICDCAGGRMNDEFVNVVEPTKGAGMTEATAEGPAKGLVEALIRYGNSQARLEGFTKADLQYAQEYLNLDLMKEFHYVFP